MADDIGPMDQLAYEDPGWADEEGQLRAHKAWYDSIKVPQDHNRRLLIVWVAILSFPGTAEIQAVAGPSQPKKLDALSNTVKPCKKEAEGQA